MKHLKKFNESQKYLFEVGQIWSNDNGIIMSIDSSEEFKETLYNTSIGTSKYRSTQEDLEWFVDQYELTLKK
jgi:hypothetical protein